MLDYTFKHIQEQKATHPKNVSNSLKLALCNDRPQTKNYTSPKKSACSIWKSNKLPLHRCTLKNKDKNLYECLKYPSYGFLKYILF